MELKIYTDKDLKIFTDDIEESAMKQINMISDHPAFENSKIRIMPDVHAGKGCVIGFTAELGDKVIPNVVGVDIGCGMYWACLGKIDIDYQKFNDVVRRYVPAGTKVHEFPQRNGFDWAKKLHCLYWIKDRSWIERSLGTLGGGNHFIEIDEAHDGKKYLIIHSGSRNLGKQVAEFYQNIAIKGTHGDPKKIRKELIEEYKAEGREKEIEKAIEELDEEMKKNQMPDDLCYLENEEMQMYLDDMRICQMYAIRNRDMIAKEIYDGMEWDYNVISHHTVHNYIGRDNIIRKGAVSAKLGEPVLIPMNMRDGCIIGTGKGDPEWNYSAPHGAGRVMSRREAKEKVSMDEYERSMRGIYSTSVNESTLDESPMAYKPMREIMEKIGETVHISEIIKPVYNFKAGD